MAESENAAPDQEFNDDGSKNPDYVAPKEGGEGGDADPDKKDGEGEGDGEGSGDDGDEKKEEFDDNADPDIPVRKSALSNIIARKNKKIKKLESQNEGGDDDSSQGGDGEGDGDGDPSATGESVQKEVEKQLKPVKEQIASESDSNELEALFKSEPDAKKYEKHIKAYMEHDVYKGVPPLAIYHHLAWTQAQAIGAKKKDAADLEADQSGSGGRDISPKGGTGTDGLPSAESISDMSDEDFEQLEQDALRGKFVK